MRKIFLLLFLYFFTILNVFALEKPKIIPRSEWWADETFTYTNSKEWQEIFKKWKENALKPKKPLTPYQKFIRKKKKEADLIITQEFPETLKTYGKITEESWNRLAWPIKYSSKIRAITIHHTESEYPDTMTWLKKIHKFHSISRQWWDIWYNFIIWYDWKIYEWRKWWETAVWAHAKYNNTQNIWISIMWSYDDKNISFKQKKALEKLVRYLVEKYEIDLTKKEPFFKKCFKKECKSALTINYQYPIIGHRDASITDCPWDILYSHIKNLRVKIMLEQLNYKNAKKKYFPIFRKLPREKLKIIQIRVKNYLKTNRNKEIEKLQKLLEDFLEKEKKILLNFYNSFKV